MDCSIITGARLIPSICGMENPQMSASMTPTFFPSFRSASPRLVVTDDFPTPPFPDATATTLVAEPVSPGSGPASRRTRAIICARSASSISSVRTSRSGTSSAAAARNLPASSESTG